jgi:hypothetical protein
MVWHDRDSWKVFVLFRWCWSAVECKLESCQPGHAESTIKTWLAMGRSLLDLGWGMRCVPYMNLGAVTKRACIVVDAWVRHSPRLVWVSVVGKAIVRYSDSTSYATCLNPTVFTQKDASPSIVGLIGCISCYIRYRLSVMCRPHFPVSTSISLI